jgi:phospholipid-binding lipoprotein MlaA
MGVVFIRWSVVLLLVMALTGPVVAGEGRPGTKDDLDWLLEETLKGDEATVELADPLEGINRIAFAFNDRLHDWVLQPVSRVYSAVLPADLRLCLKNFFCNLSSPVFLANDLLQGKFVDGAVVVSRFVLNSTIGIGGLVDVAESDFGLKLQKEDLGQTLGIWGVGDGFYICWPLLGPSTLRDSVGMVGDGLLHPLELYQGAGKTAPLAYTATRQLNRFSLNPDIYTDVRRFSLDPYVAMRQAYAEYRQNALLDRSEGRDGVNGLPLNLQLQMD